MSTSEQDYATKRKSQLQDFATQKTTSNAQETDFPAHWSVSRTGSGRVSRMSFEPPEPIEFAEAQKMAEAANAALMGHG